MYDTPLTIEQNLALLAATPARLAEITQGLSAVQLVTPPEPREWSARDVLPPKLGSSSQLMLDTAGLEQKTNTK